ncbi:MAG TPA: hypothetical protein VGD88_16560 [Opitutaceae bacterium]
MRSLSRLIPPAAGLLGLAAPVVGQTLNDFRLADLEFVDGPVNAFSISTRLVGRASVNFTNLGGVSSGHEVTDLTSEVTRTYDDGRVSKDTRTDTDGNDLLDDGRTNSWYYYSASQVTPDESGISFHQYSSVSDGQSRSAESDLLPGLDVEYSLRLGLFDRPAPGLPARVSWGLAVGIGFSDINVKTSGKIYATLHRLTDTYSLLGAAVPDVGDGDDDSDDDIDDTDGVGYTSPSQRIETVTNADGTTTSYVVDTTTLLANRPESRVEETFEGGAEIDGFWQVKGASMSIRTGPWMRWQPAEKFSLRLSAGGVITWLGLQMRYDERLVAANGRLISDSTSTLIQEIDETESQSYGVGGLFTGLDAEWWLTRRTGFFGSAYYEQFSKEGTISAGERGAEIEISSGVGVRFGITTRF